MTKNTKATLTVVLVSLAALAVALIAFRPGSPAPAPAAAQGSPPVAPELLVREDSHRLSSAPDGKVTLVEFLDFECEACRAAFPVVEGLRAEYGNRITVVARYFPIPSHANAENAAIAVEAAAGQGRFEDMYRKMYETQATWGERRESKAILFRVFAAELGLDLGAYDRAVADPATRERIMRDRADGTAAGVQGTPTFFLNGARVQPRSADELRTLIDAALAR
ncbi:thioredoxin domain-containing protein [Actinomycetes bacterium KLBMP 9759]